MVFGFKTDIFDKKETPVPVQVQGQGVGEGVGGGVVKGQTESVMVTQAEEVL